MSRSPFTTEAELAAYYAKHGFQHEPVASTPTPGARAMPERALLAQVRRLAQEQGWLVYHTWRSEHSEPGFPDVVLAKPGRLLFVELKSAQGKVTVEQQQWLEVLKRSVPGIEIYLWRPADLPEILEVLQ